MIAALSQWPYEPDHVPQDYWDDTGVLQEGGFEDTVGRALSDGLLSDEDYHEILDALPS